MKCSSCGSTDYVTVGDKSYCTNCGSVVSPETASIIEPAVPPAAPPASASSPTLSANPQPRPAPATSVRLVGANEPNLPIIAAPPSPAYSPTPSPDIAVPIQVAPPIGAPPIALTPSNPDALDLRNQPTASVAPPSAEIQRKNYGRIVTPQQATTPIEAGSVTKSIPDTPKSNQINRFPSPSTQPLPVSPQPSSASQDFTPQHQPRVTMNDLSAAPAPAAARPGTVIAPAELPPIPAVSMPPKAVTQHQNLATLAAATSTPNLTHDETITLTTGPSRSTKPQPMAVAATAAVIVIMGGYVWLQNYPKMALHAASGRAGFVASLPSYVPSTYSLNGGINSSPGLISFKFNSPSTQPFTVTQRATNWDSTALLDNYVAEKSNNYTAVEGQGLTIYVYDNNQVAWVNHGIWYTIEGATRLSRDQVLKIAYSL